MKSDNDLFEPATPAAKYTANRIRASLATTPLREVLTGEGGIAFEWRRGSVFKTVEVDRCPLNEEHLTKE